MYIFEYTSWFSKIRKQKVQRGIPNNILSFRSSEMLLFFVFGVIKNVFQLVGYLERAKIQLYLFAIVVSETSLKENIPVDTRLGDNILLFFIIIFWNTSTDECVNFFRYSSVP